MTRGSLPGPSDPKSGLTVVLPTYNGRPSLPRVVAEIREVLRGVPREILKGVRRQAVVCNLGNPIIRAAHVVETPLSP